MSPKDRTPLPPDLAAEVEVAEENGALNRRHNENDKDDKEEAKDVVQLVAPG